MYVHFYSAIAKYEQIIIVSSVFSIQRSHYRNGHTFSCIFYKFSTSVLNCCVKFNTANSGKIHSKVSGTGSEHRIQNWIRSPACGGPTSRTGSASATSPCSDWPWTCVCYTQNTIFNILNGYIFCISIIFPSHQRYFSSSGHRREIFKHA